MTDAPKTSSRHRVDIAPLRAWPMIAIAIFVCIAATAIGGFFGEGAALPYLPLSDWINENFSHHAQTQPASQPATGTTQAAATTSDEFAENYEYHSPQYWRMTTLGLWLGGGSGLLTAIGWSLWMDRHRRRVGRAGLVGLGSLLGLASGTISTLALHIGLAISAVERSRNAAGGMGWCFGLGFGLPSGLTLGLIGGLLCALATPADHRACPICSRTP